MRDRDEDLLYQMRSYCTKIGDRIETYSINEEEFIENTALQDMLLIPVFQIGELARSLSLMNSALLTRKFLGMP